MSKRLQVLLDECEYAELHRIAERRGLTLSEWVRQAIAAARRREPEKDAASKLAAIRAAAQQSFPTGDIQQMLEEAERGYLTDLP